MLSATRTIFRTEGGRSLYKGLSPTLLQIAPYSGLQFFFFTKLSQMAKKFLSPNSNDVDAKFLPFIGLMSGLIAKTITYPSDVVKKRLQVVGFGDARRDLGVTKNHRNMIKCIIDIKHTEGYKGFYKGFAPSVIKAMLTSSLLFYVYEISCRYMSSLNKRN